MNNKLLKEFKQILLNELFPIGKTEIFYDNADHSNYMGFKWERTALDRFVKGYSPNVNTVGSTGGEKTHKLTINEMPSHYHAGYYKWLNQDAAADSGTWGTNAWSKVVSKKYTSNSIKDDGGDGSQVGGSQAHNNEPQYQVFAIWKRIS